MRHSRPPNRRASEKGSSPHSTAPKRLRDAAATREHLRNAAEAIFIQQGFDGARVDDIAAHAGVNKRMIYVYFGDKEGLYRDVLRSSYSRVTSRERPVLDPAAAPHERLESWIVGYFTYLAAEPGLVRLIEWEGLDNSGRSAEILQEVGRQELDELTRIIGGGIECGAFRSDLGVRQTVMLIHSTCFGVLSRRRLWASLWGTDFMDPETVGETATFVARSLVEGIGRKSPSTTPPAAGAAPEPRTQK